MSSTDCFGPAAIRADLGAIFVSLELSRKRWLVTSLSPGAGEKMSRHGLAGGDVSGLLALIADLQRKAQARTGCAFGIVSVQEAGLDGFWLHRLLQAEGWRATSSIRPRWRSIGAGGAPRPIASTGRRCCAR
jgi:transposase